MPRLAVRGPTVLALICGALVGSIITAALIMLLDWRTGDDPFFARNSWSGVVGGVVFITIVGPAPVFSTGLFVVGAPSWYFLHRFGYRSWVSLTVLGALLTFAANLAFYGDTLGRMTGLTGPYGRVEWAFVMGVVGAMVGWVMWHVANRNIPPNPG